MSDKWWENLTPLTLQFEQAASLASTELDIIAEEYGDDTLTGRLEKSFDSGNDIIAGMISDMKQITDAAVSNVVSVEAAYEMADGDVSKMGTWVTTGGGNVCAGCDALHGEQMTLEEFAATQGTNECGFRCYCFWLPGTPDVAEAKTKMWEIEKEHPSWFKLDRKADIRDFKIRVKSLAAVTTPLKEGTNPASTSWGTTEIHGDP